jgi:replicative DNA helicase
MSNKQELDANQLQGWTISAAIKKPAFRLQLLKRGRSADFVGANRVLFDALEGQTDGGKFDILAYLDAVGDGGRKRLQEIDGEFLLMPDEYVFDSWLDKIVENSHRRDAFAKLQNAAARIERGDTVDDVFGELAQALYNDRQRANADMVTLSAGVDRVGSTLAQWESGDQHVDTIPTGFAKVDRILGGMLRKNITTIGARPGAGKTQLALQIARNMALWAQSKKRDSVIVVFSAEMGVEQLVFRLASCASGVPLDAMKTNTATPEQKAEFRKALDFIRTLNIVIDETPAPTTAQMFVRVAIEAMLHGDGVDAVVFDYIELAGEKSNETEDARIGNIMRGLKVIAKCFNCVVVALSQLNRKVEDRNNKIPGRADLRGSGWIEALSQTIILMMRPDYYAENVDDKPVAYENSTLEKMAEKLGENAVRVDVAKNRDGKTGMTVLRFAASITRFYEDTSDSLANAKRRIEAKEAQRGTR